VPSRGGGITSGEPLMCGGAFDQVDGLPLATRHDVVAFQTAPLTEPVVVVGEVRLEVDFSTTAPDTDLAVKLVDVHPANEDYPGGFAMNITDHMLRLRYREDPARPRLMVPEQVYAVTVRLPDTANRFEVGHRLRLDITSSNFPRCDVNPNTGAPVMGDRTRAVARNTIHLGRSHLVLSALEPQ
jgi:putative CocE/NonD family hydrolase